MISSAWSGPGRCNIRPGPLQSLRKRAVRLQQLSISKRRARSRRPLVRPKRNSGPITPRGTGYLSLRLCGVILSAHSCRPAATDSRGCVRPIGSSNAWFRVWSCSCPICVPIPAWSPRSDRRPTTTSASGGARPDMILLHYTGMRDGGRRQRAVLAGERSVRALRRARGRPIIQLVAEERRAWRASTFRGETDINSCSIGIEIANPGHDQGYPIFRSVRSRPSPRSAAASSPATRSRPTACSATPTWRRRASRIRAKKSVAGLLANSGIGMWGCRRRPPRATVSTCRARPIRRSRRRSVCSPNTATASTRRPLRRHHPRHRHRLPAAFSAVADRRRARPSTPTTLKALIEARDAKLSTLQPS